MFVSFRPDLKIPFERLLDGRLKEFQIDVERGVDIFDRPTATLTQGDLKVLVRTHDGTIERLIPSDRSSAFLIASVGCACDCAFDQISEDLGSYADLDGF
jgi:hypothetical protein